MEICCENCKYFYNAKGVEDPCELCEWTWSKFVENEDGIDYTINIIKEECL